MSLAVWDRDDGAVHPLWGQGQQNSSCSKQLQHLHGHSLALCVCWIVGAVGGIFFILYRQVLVNVITGHHLLLTCWYEQLVKGARGVVCSASLIIAASETWSNDLHTSFNILCAHTWPGVSSAHTALSCTVLRATDTCHTLIPTLCLLTTPPSCRYNCYHLSGSHLPITFPFHNTLTIIIIPLVPLVPLVTLVPLSPSLYVCSYTQTGTHGIVHNQFLTFSFSCKHQLFKCIYVPSMTEHRLTFVLLTCCGAPHRLLVVHVYCIL